MEQLPAPIELTAPQARVLGALIEKQATTPDAYPMTLNALTTACNQSSNRDPVVQYEAQLVETTVLALKAKGLARVVHPGSGERATKYRHVADEALGLGPAERAIVGVLLLRGPQTVNELKVRTERLHGFDGTAAVEAVLDQLSRADPPFVAQVERQPGQKEPRWIDLLQANPEERAAASATSGAVTPSSRGAGRVDELEARVDALERRLAQLVAALGDLVDLADDPADLQV